MRLRFLDIKPPSNTLILIAQLIIVAYYIPYFVLGENANILIHDNLDSNVAWIKILLDNNAAFAHPLKIIPTVFDGLPVFNIYATYDISLLIFKVFGVFQGYVINKFLISLIGFWGMYLLLKRHFSSLLNSPFVIIGTSLIFALLPFWSFSATVLGLPFVLFAFLNLRNNTASISNWVILILFGFYSSLILSGFFILLLLLVMFLYETIKARRVNWSFFLGLVVLSMTYLISHFPLIYGTLGEGSQSHRVEFFTPAIGFNLATYTGFKMFVVGQHHAHSLPMFIAFPITIILLVWQEQFSKTIKLMIVFIILTSLFYGFQHYQLVKPAVDAANKVIPLQLQRFHFLHPMFWYVLFATSLGWIVVKIKHGQTLAMFIILFQVCYVSSYHEVWLNRAKPTFKEFYAEDTFTKIKGVIDKPIDSYKVISVGMHPSIAQYNGFNTLDGYFPTYPLHYKHKFRKVIEGELARNERLELYFDNWGSRCYAFSSEIGKEYVNNNKKQIDSLKYDFQHLVNMGGAYILSVSSINELLNPELKLIDIVNSPMDNYWNIYVYEIKKTEHEILFKE